MSLDSWSILLGPSSHERTEMLRKTSRRVGPAVGQRDMLIMMVQYQPTLFEQADQNQKPESAAQAPTCASLHDSHLWPKDLVWQADVLL